MRILFVLENYLPHIGGVEVVFMNLAEGLAKLGHDITIVTHRLKNTKKFEVIRGVKIQRVDCFYSRYLFTFLSIPTVLKFAKKADIIHTTTFNGAGPAWLVAKLLGKPVVITIHEVWINQWDKLTNFIGLKLIAHDFLERLIYLLPFDKFLAVSNSTRNQLHNINISPKRTKTIYDGLNYSHFDPKKYSRTKIRKQLKLQNNFICLVRGRAGPSKGIEYAIRAFPKILEKIPKATLLLILSQDKQYLEANQYLKDLVKELKISKQVIFHPPVSWSELPAYIKAADCVIVPSLAEGFGFNAAEACAMDIPVVASNTTSLPEVVSGKYLLIEPGDSNEIAKAVIKVKNKKFNKSKLKRFGLNKNINKYIKIYKEFKG